MTRFPILLLSILLSLSSLSLLDFERALVLRVEGMMKLSPTTKSYTYLGDGWFEFTGEDGLTWQRNFGDTRTMGGLKPKKIISIDLRLVDTTGFGSLFEELAIVHIGNASAPPAGSNFGRDGLAELNGQYYQQGVGDYPWMTKQISGTHDFENFLRFQEKYKMFDVDDVDQNSIQELVGDSLGSIMTFEPNSSGERILKKKYFWYGVTGSAKVPRITDLDGDGFPEIIQRQFGNGFLGSVVIKYNSSSHSLQKVFGITYRDNPDFRGYWAVGDFDMDRRMEFVTATRDGQVRFVEHISGDTSYTISFSDTTRYINAFYHTEGNDLDGDGRPECFIGSDNTGGLNNIAVYETIGDNQFEVSLWIEIYPLGSFIWPWIWAGDVTSDRKEELVLTSGNALVILKAFGDDDYRVIWFKRYNSEISHRLFDVDNDGKKEVILSFIDNAGIHKTRILSYQQTTRVEPIQTHSASFSFHVHPNPATTRIITSFTSSTSQSYDASLIDITGRIVYRSSGHFVQGMQSSMTIPTESLTNGIYLLHVKVKNEMSSQKLLILK